MRVALPLIILFAAATSHARQTLEFGAFEASVATQLRDDGTEVTVALALFDPLFGAQLLNAQLSVVKGGPCFVAPDALVVTLDGKPMPRIAAGGPMRPTMISGMALHLTRCLSPVWRLQLPANAKHAGLDAGQ